MPERRRGQQDEVAAVWRREPEWYVDRGCVQRQRRGAILRVGEHAQEPCGSSAPFPALRDFAGRLRAAGTAPKVVVVAVMRTLLELARTLLRRGQPFSVSQGTVASTP